MAILQILACALGRHRRDRHAAWHDGDTYRTVCVGCGVPMVREFHGWEVAPKVDPDDPGGNGKA